MSVQVWFEHEEMSVQPGTPSSVSVAVENLGDSTETFTLLPAGLSAAWLTVTRPTITLFAGSTDVVEVVIRPPVLDTTSAGATPAAVRVIPQSDPDSTVTAEIVLDVQPFDDRRITLLQPLQRGRHRATYEFMVENHGNSLATCRLHLIDSTNRVDGQFDPPAIGVSPGASSLVRLKLTANRGVFRRTERQLDFEIEATQQDHEPAAARGALIQPPTIPGQLIRRLVGAAALVGLLVAAWFALIRPELRDAADVAVADRLAELEDATVPVVEVDTTEVPSGDETTTDSTPDTVDGPPVLVAEEAAGELFWIRLAVSAGLNQEGSRDFTVPPDSRFELTDVVLQNPNGDSGTAVLLGNGQPLYQWNLGAMAAANEFQPRVSPLGFGPDDTIALTSRCEGVGDTTGTQCEVAVLVTGRLFPADDS